MKKILFVPHPKLRQKADTISKVTKKEIDISKKMIEIMKITHLRKHQLNQ